MLRLIALRGATTAATLWAASVVVFLVMSVLPGDPALIMLGMNAEESTLAAVRGRMGLDRPPLERYLRWIGGFLTGDLGTSHIYARPVLAMVAERLWLTLPLAVLAMALAVAVALPVGVVAATRRGRVTDGALMGAAQLGVAVPNFWFALLLMLLFAVQLRWLPSGGFPGWEGGVGGALAALLLPVIALALPQGAILARITRSAVLDTLNEDYVRTARAKGLSRGRALWAHAVPNALIPIVTLMGLQFSFLIAGTVIIEQVFSLPGVGRLLFQAITQRDLPVVQGVVMLLVTVVLLVNLLVDLAYLALDPRLRVGAGS